MTVHQQLTQAWDSRNWNLVQKIIDDNCQNENEFRICQRFQFGLWHRRDMMWNADTEWD